MKSLRKKRLVIPDRITLDMLPENWFAQGTLVGATVKQWHESDWKNALATAAAWCTVMQSNNGKTSPAGNVIHVDMNFDKLNHIGAERLQQGKISVQELPKWLSLGLLDYALGLARALTGGTRNSIEAIADQKIADYVPLCLQQMGLLWFDKPGQLLNELRAEGHTVPPLQPSPAGDQHNGLEAGTVYGQGDQADV